MKRMLILVLCLMMIGCGSKKESTATITTKDDPKVERSKEKKRKVKEELIYKDDESINSFLNRYNEINDLDITSDMVSKRHLKGTDRDDIVNISDDRFEIILYGKGIIGDEMDVFIQAYPHDDVTNDDYKEQLIKYIRVYNNTLTDEEINKYWAKMIEDPYENRKLKKINIWPNVSNGKVQYFKIEGNIEFKNK